jgi:predicted MFS family arabinose efflux permease
MDAPPQLSRGSRRVTFAAALALAMGSGTYAGYAFGALGPSLVNEFDISRFQLGLLTAAFFVVGGPLSLAAGRATDRYGARRVMLVSFSVAATAIAGMALSPAYALLVAFAALAGVALATGNPVTNKLVAVNIPRGERGLIMGGKQAGVQVAAFLTGALLVPAAVAVGWRAAFGWSALVPLAGVAVALVAVPADRPLHETRDNDRSAPLPHGVRWLAAYAFLMGSGVATVNAYLPLYLVEEGHASQAMAGVVVATIGFVGIGSRIAWGWASERMRTYATPLTILGGGALLAILMVLAVPWAGMWLAIPAAVVFGASAVTWNAVGMLAVITSAGTAQAGRATGVVTFGFYVGFVASPLLFGLAVDQLGSYVPAWIGVAGCFAATWLVIRAWSSRSG